MGRDPTDIDWGYGSSRRLDRTRRSVTNTRTFISSIYNRIAVDVAQIDFKHVRVNKDGLYESDIDSPLNTCLTLETSIDQTARTFRQDLVMSMCDEGVIAAVPVDADLNLTKTQVQGANISEMRTGKIIAWYPQAVTVELYNSQTGKHQNVTLPKSLVAIIENPFYAIMNEPNSTMQRLLQTVAKLDKFNDQNTAGKLDLIIQLPYVVKSDTRKRQAEERRKAIEEQLTDSKYGVAYTDGTEKVIQLNRSLENNLFEQTKALKQELYALMGITEEILNGTANEQTMINYRKRCIEVFCTAIAEEYQRKFLTPTARSQGQAIRFFDDPFKLVPVSQIAEMTDKFTRGKVMTANEIRAKIGLRPANDQTADMLINPNLNQSTEEIMQQQQLANGEMEPYPEDGFDEQQHEDIGEV